MDRPRIRFTDSGDDGILRSSLRSLYISVVEKELDCFATLAMTMMLLFLPITAHAACTSPAGDEGDIVYNADQNVPQVCTQGSWVAMGILNPAAGGTGCTSPVGDEGDIVYNADILKPQYCDGNDWVAMLGTISGGCIPAPPCSNVGDVCADGSIFAGVMVYNGSCKPLYVTDNNQSVASQWKTATGTNDITDPADKNDAADGQYNRDNRGAGTFPAFELCENNTYHGKSDWYLPARAELNLLWLNQAAIDANAAGNFTTDGYWSSTEASTGNAWTQGFTSSTQFDSTKTLDRDVRCVRRD